MSLPKTPHEFKGEDWTSYVLEAVGRETGDSSYRWEAHKIATWTKLLKGLRSDGMDPYMLALGIDLIALEWDNAQRVSPYELLSTGRLTWFFYQTVRPSYYWRAVWFSRYARTEQEAEYYRFWLSQLEVTVDAGDGTPGKSEWISRSREKLEYAEQRIRERSGAPRFLIHYLRGLHAP